MLNLIALLGAFLLPSPVIASTTPPVSPNLPVIEEKTPSELVSLYATEYGVDEQIMRGIIKCESGWVTDIQSNYTYSYDRPEIGKKAGEREESYGLVQIHLPAHKHITKEQAIDPEFAIEFLAKELSKGNGKIWTCYNLVKDV